MAAPGRKKTRGILTTRNVLFAVPSLWICIIVWTVYDAQIVQQNEYRVQLETIKRQHQQQKEDHLQQQQQQKIDLQRQQDKLKEEHKQLKEIEVRRNKDKHANETLDVESRQKKNFILRQWHKDEKEKAAPIPSVKETVFKVDHAPTDAPPPDDHDEYIWAEEGERPEKRHIVPGGRFDPPKEGENGRPLAYDPKHFGTDDRIKYDKGWTDHQYNEWASLQISTQREIQDFRNPGCRAANYGDISVLPKATVIICFYNEAWSVLLRTIHSVLGRSPPGLIEEVILVDDHSDMSTLLKPLEKYVSQVFKLRLLRMRKRSGLVKARLAGVRRAKAPVLIFLDSHVECAEGWLTPMLKTIKDKPKVAVTPEIDVIDHKNFAVQAAIDNIGILDFRSFSFDWSQMMPRLQTNRTSEADVIVSPTMAGGLFAIRKDYFIELGTYDPDLELWGGENIELSLKLWMCGGGILIHPCSRVAHIFRDQSPYLKGSKENVLSKNSARVAQVWADDFRRLYFKGGVYDETKYGSVASRLQLKKDLGCKTFSWYVDNIYPEMNVAFTGQCRGQIKSSQGTCLHTAMTGGTVYIALVPCRIAENWDLSRSKTVGSNGKCLEMTSRGLVVVPCVTTPPPSQVWEYTTTKTIKNPKNNTCLTALQNTVVVATCTGSDGQIWEWPTNPNYIV